MDAAEYIREEQKRGSVMPYMGREKLRFPMASVAVCGMLCNPLDREMSTSYISKTGLAKSWNAGYLMAISHELRKHFTANPMPWAARCVKYVMKWK
jgi:hypothetical protein